MKVAFVNPPQQQLREPLAYPHLGIASLSTMVWHECRLDNLAGGWNGELEHADIFLITTPTACRPSVSEIVAYIREAYPKSIVILGGPHATLAPVDTARMKPDYVVQGEADHFMLELGELERQHNGVHIIDAGYVKDLNRLPIPNRSLFDDSVVVNTTGIHGSLKPSTTMSTARGCPYSCAYCCKGHDMYRKLRLRNPDHIKAELSYLQNRYGIEHVRFVDDTFTIRKDRTIEICNVLKEFNISFICMTRADRIDSEVAEALGSAECLQVQIGLESGSDRMLTLMNKCETVENHRWAINALHGAGVPVKILLMMGFPGETANDRQQTIEFLSEIKPESFNLARFTPLPGSAIPWNGETNFFYPDTDPEWQEYQKRIHEAIK